MDLKKGDMVEMLGVLFEDGKPRFGVITEYCLSGYIKIKATNGKEYGIRSDNENIRKATVKCRG